MPNEMIDRVAAALDQVSQTAPSTLSYAEMMRAFAVAAIKAMREPTEEMVAAAHYVSFAPGATAYTAMIDVASGESKLK